MRGIALAIPMLAASSTLQAGTTQTERAVASIFAGHDCCGRLEHSEIKPIGEIRSSGRTFTIYSLWFVNPQSRHGMKRLAVTEGRRFIGSYVISSWATPVLKAGVVKFVCDNDAPCEGADFAIVNEKLPSGLWVDGEVSILEDTI